MKTIVTYFSASGVTKGVSEKIANMIDGDTFEIVPKTIILPKIWIGLIRKVDQQSR